MGLEVETVAESASRARHINEIRVRAGEDPGRWRALKAFGVNSLKQTGRHSTVRPGLAGGQLVTHR